MENNLAILLSATVSQHVIKFKFVNTYKHAFINNDISFQSAFTVFQSIKIMVFRKLLKVSVSRYGAVFLVVLRAVL